MSESPQYPGDTVTGAPPARRNGLGTAALVLGILAVVLILLWFVSIPLGVVAIVLGVAGRRRARRGQATNRGAATAGIVLGALAVVIAGVLAAAGIALLTSDSGKDYQACVKKAETQAQRQKCADDFGRSIGH
jgi:lysylphosphatidylglycerol synthetase-like protein (DUF2156 family)